MRISAEGEIRARIARQGRITFAEFIEIALYHPGGGYYTRGAPSGAHRDYYTSPAAHPAFGALISIQLWRMWHLMACPCRFYAIEMGAGNGLLARDVTEYASALPGPFSEALRYVALDRSPTSVAGDGRPARHQRIVTGRTSVKGVVGCILSNELVDSFPVHRFEIQSGTVKEIFLSLQKEGFVEVLDEPSSPVLADRLQRLSFPLPEGYRGEVNPQVGAWIADVASALERGFVLTIDYGYEREDLYSAERAGGTLQTYNSHASGASPYQRIGMQDLTAHVDFSSLVSEGKASGLEPVGLTTQACFLADLGIRRWLDRLRAERLGQRERDANAMAMRELIKPEGLGAFRVLVQEKGTGVKNLGQLVPSEMPVDDLPVPLLRLEHVPLMAGRYPHLTWDSEQTWPQG